MPRNIKCRRVCAEPENKVFTPENTNADFLTLSVDEFEAIRLCDLEELDQDIAAERMGISRGTFQRILYSSHKIIAQALCSGKGILIDGGNYELAGNNYNCVKKCKVCRFNDNFKEMK